MNKNFKFKYKDIVTIIHPFFKGTTGKVVDCMDNGESYLVEWIMGTHSGSRYFEASELKERKND